MQLSALSPAMTHSAKEFAADLAASKKQQARMAVQTYSFTMAAEHINPPTFE